MMRYIHDDIVEYNPRYRHLRNMLVRAKQRNVGDNSMVHHWHMLRRFGYFKSICRLGVAQIMYGSDREKNGLGATLSNRVNGITFEVHRSKKKLAVPHDRGFSLNGTGICATG